jgi:hypothetical protein
VVPHAQRPWTALGLLLGATGAAAGAVTHPGFALLGVAGIALALLSLGSVRRARRRMGAIDARLAALRVRERAIERHFEAEGAPVRALLRTLGLDGVDALAEAVARYRSRLEQLDLRKRALAKAERSFPEGDEADLAELEERLAALPAPADLGALRARIARLARPPSPRSPARRPAPPATPPPPPPVRPVPVDPLRAADAPERTLRAAAAWVGRPAGEIAAALAPALLVYLRSLTRGGIQGAEAGPEGFVFHVRGRAEPVPFAKLGDDRRAEVALSLRLALLERLAPQRPIPVIVRPDALGLDPEAAQALVRALRRLSAVTQVVQLR